MKVIYDYSYKGGEEVISEDYDELYDEIMEMIPMIKETANNIGYPL